MLQGSYLSCGPVSCPLIIQCLLRGLDLPSACSFQLETQMHSDEILPCLFPDSFNVKCLLKKKEWSKNSTLHRSATTYFSSCLHFCLLQTLKTPAYFYSPLERAADFTNLSYYKALSHSLNQPSPRACSAHSLSCHFLPFPTAPSMFWATERSYSLCLIFLT